jgi:hypothetical protein
MKDILLGRVLPSSLCLENSAPLKFKTDCNAGGRELRTWRFGEPADEDVRATWPGAVDDVFFVHHERQSIMGGKRV